MISKSLKKTIQEKLTLGNLEEFCENISPLDNHPDVCLTGGKWGEFTVRRDPIMRGVRFFILSKIDQRFRETAIYTN